MKAKRRNSQAGYTLVELLVATALGAIVLGAITSILLTTALSANVATSRIDASSQVRTFQLTAYDDLALSAVPIPVGCGSQSNPCTTQPMVLQGMRVPNLDSGAATPYSVTYTWDPARGVVTRQVAGGGSRTIATNVTSFSWFVDPSGAHASVVINLTVTVITYNASYSESQSLRFYPRIAGP
jgi:prepilin-type N-terminal cleavage/methylation domain-containing protein